MPGPLLIIKTNNVKNLFRKFITAIIRTELEEFKTQWNLIDEDSSEDFIKMIDTLVKPAAGDTIRLKPINNIGSPGAQQKYFVINSVEHSETGFTGNLYGKLVD